MEGAHLEETLHLVHWKMKEIMAENILLELMISGMDQETQMNTTKTLHKVLFRDSQKVNTSKHRKQKIRNAVI